MIAILAALAVAAANAHPPPCRMVHGRLFLANGTPSVRIWNVGSRRILGVVQPNETFDDLPENVRDLWNANGDEAMWRTDLVGDFLVCPVGRERPGRMGMVELRSATHLRATPRP